MPLIWRKMKKHSSQNVPLGMKSPNIVFPRPGEFSEREFCFGATECVYLGSAVCSQNLLCVHKIQTEISNPGSFTFSHRKTHFVF